jgi:phosphoenolpyruvate carboxykinase (GTP)
MPHPELERWVAECAELTAPDQIYWCDGSEAEIQRLNAQMVASGTLIELDAQRYPNCYLARSDIHDVARVEGQTFICTTKPEDAGPTNNWQSPTTIHQRLRILFRRCMTGRTMYVIPYLMGPVGSPMSRVGVEITDSPYVVANMRIMTRMGRVALDALGENGHFVKGLHSIGLLDPKERHICHFPEEDQIISFSSNYGGNALLGKKCFALRLASALGKREGWMAEHMLILGITDPRGRKTYVAGAFPSACGKTNLAMLIPPEKFQREGWKVETVGDDIAWLKFGADGRLYAINPEAGFFGVAPGTSERTNPNAMATVQSNTLFTNVALLPDRTVWWEGMTPTPPAQCIDWMGNPWTPASTTPAAHPNSRFTAPARQCPSIAAEWERPEGVPISAIIFGGRRSTVLPLVYQAFTWQHGTYMGATMTSEKTAAAAGTVGVLRYDPMAMLPFCGYNMADYWQHWLDMGARGGDKMPLIFHVNWFRKNADGKYVWPGFGENMRVLKWIVDRTQGSEDSVETPIGWMPTPESLKLAELGISSDDQRCLLSAQRDEWLNEVRERAEFFKQFGDRLPPRIREENDALRRRLE